MKQGDRVFITVDNSGQYVVIIDVRAEEPRWLVRIDDGTEVWCFTYEVSDD